MANDPIGDALDINATDGCGEVTPIKRDVEIVGKEESPCSPSMYP